ncbi:hypothetical protein C0993_011844 [Termitomyces sp. T159_Od127]|nr:hypothetical protein C0993_011844 [Termitomyces sp. T159_Od127]
MGQHDAAASLVQPEGADPREDDRDFTKELSIDISMSASLSNGMGEKARGETETWKGKPKRSAEPGSTPEWRYTFVIFFSIADLTANEYTARLRSIGEE